MFKCKESGVNEHQPAQYSEHDETVAKCWLVQVENLTGVEVELLGEEQGDVDDDVAADEDGQLDAALLSQLGPGHRVALGQQDQQQQEADLGCSLQNSSCQFGWRRSVSVHPVGEVGEGGQSQTSCVEKNWEPK